MVNNLTRKFYEWCEKQGRDYELDPTVFEDFKKTHYLTDREILRIQRNILNGLDKEFVS